MYICVLYHLLISSRLVSSHLISSHLISSHLISFHFISCHFISSHLISSHLISSHLISSHLISSLLFSSLLISSFHFFFPLFRQRTTLSRTCCSDSCSITTGTLSILYRKLSTLASIYGINFSAFHCSCCNYSCIIPGDGPLFWGHHSVDKYTLCRLFSCIHISHCELRAFIPIRRIHPIFLFRGKMRTDC